MPRHFSSAVCAAALLLAGASTIALSPPAGAAIAVRIGYDFFHDRLAPQGRWIHHPIWGDVWRPRPRLVGPDFQPYMNGYWQYTDEYGWYWVSNDPFDDVVYHYGRWVYDPQWGWLWMPGYTWAPAWVAWREGDDYTGWAPLPPDEAFISGAGLSFGVNLGPLAIDFYDRWYRGRVDPSRFFVFVDNRHLVERDYRRFVVPRERVKIVLGRTRDVTKFEVANGRVVNRGIDLKVVERATGRPIVRVSAKAVIKPGAVVTTVDEAKQVRERERVAHPMNVEAIRRGNAGAAGEASGKGANETGGAGGMAPERNAGKPGAGEPGGAMKGGESAGAMKGEKGDAMTSPTGETSAPGETPKKKQPRSEGRMSNPSGESMTGPSTETETPKKKRPGSEDMGGPGGGMMGSGEGNAGSGEPAASNPPGGSEGGAPAPRHRTKPAGSMGSPSSGEGAGSTGTETPPAPRHNPGGSASQPGPAAGPSESGSAQTPPPPKKKRKPDNSEQSEPAPH